MSAKTDLTCPTAVLATMLVGNNYDPKAIGRSITALRGLTDKVDARAHATAMAILYYSLPDTMGGHRDCSKAVGLVQALGKGGRANAMIAWFHRHSNVRFTEPKGKGLTASMLNEKHAKLWRELTKLDLDAAMADPYWAKPSVEGTAKFLTDDTFVSRLESLIAAFDKDGAAVNNADNVVLIDIMRRRVAQATSAKNLAAVQALGIMGEAPKAQVQANG